MIEKFFSFSPDSKVWIYGANRKLNQIEISEIQLALDTFTASWTAHEVPLKSIGSVLDEHFIVLMVDETIANVSGCGIDKSVKLLQSLSARYSIDLFNRMQAYFFIDNKVLVMPLAETSEAYNLGIISDDTIMFNTLVRTKSELENSWMVKIKDSWIGNRLARINKK